jgi:hypothetical protein
LAVACLTLADPTLIKSLVIIRRRVMLYRLQVLRAKTCCNITFVRVGSELKSR